MWRWNPIRESRLLGSIVLAIWGGGDENEARQAVVMAIKQIVGAELGDLAEIKRIFLTAKLKAAEQPNSETKLKDIWESASEQSEIFSDISYDELMGRPAPRASTTKKTTKKTARKKTTRKKTTRKTQTAPPPPTYTRRRRSGTCQIDGCDEESRGKPLCRKHYYEKFLRAVSEVIGKEFVEICQHPGCDQPSRGQPLCREHYYGGRKRRSRRPRRPYRRNIDMIEGHTTKRLVAETLDVVEDKRFNRLHFGGRLDVEDIRLLAILDVGLARRNLREILSDQDYRKSVQLKNLDLRKFTSGMSKRIAMQAVFWIYKNLTPDAVTEVAGIMPRLAIARAFSFIGSAGSFLDDKMKDQFTGLSEMDVYDICTNLINQAGMLGNILNQISAETAEDEQTLASFSDLLGSLRNMLLATCQPTCPDPDCEVEHELPVIEEARKELLTSSIKFALDAGIYKEYRRDFVNNLLFLYEHRII